MLKTISPTLKGLEQVKNRVTDNPSVSTYTVLRITLSFPTKMQSNIIKTSLITSQ